jgi:hypothetical protein
VFGGGHDSTEGVRARIARGRPIWWVILAVSLGLMALLVAVAGNTTPSSRRGDRPAQASARAPGPRSRPHATTTPVTTPATTTTTTTPAARAASSAANVPASLHTTGVTGTVGPQQAPAPIVTTTTLAPATTTTTAPSAAVPADRMQTQGYLNPPLQPSNKYGFTGTGAMEVSVVWSGSTYLTLEVSCPSGDQSGGGTAAMQASLPDANGSCLATVTEPASESASLTYTISIGPAGG